MALVRHDADLWSTEYEIGGPAGLLPIPVRTTVIRIGGGSLVLHSPGPISDELHDELAALGSVDYIVVPQAHGMFAAQAAQRFPAAQLLSAPGAPWRRKSVAFHGALADHPPAAWEDRVESHLLLGFRLQEVVLFHRPSRSLVLTDLCFNVQRSESSIARALFRANGMWRRFGPSRLIRLLVVSDRAALERSLEHLLRWDFDRILPGHGDIIETGGPAALRAAWP